MLNKSDLSGDDCPHQFSVYISSA